MLPFARVGRLASGKGAALAPPDEASMIAEFRWAITAVARRVPFRAKCFEQGLTAQWMLRRRGIASTLFYGIARDRDRALSAHVWVRSGAFDVVGCDNIADFATVAQFPAARSDTPPQTSRPLPSDRPGGTGQALRHGARWPRSRVGPEAPEDCR
ncbi:lasso peptide biosynthesis B2 protein [Sphingomonas sp. 7/4-4]|uniref:lasso peptide biosynthesis B2 protein n=1 Tax=Sphingomonas sp. 7/4-4 TaxID=3018446 RepID=UPI003FA75F8E